MILIDTSPDLISVTLKTWNFGARFYLLLLLIMFDLVSSERASSEGAFVKVRMHLQNHHLFI